MIYLRSHDGKIKQGDILQNVPFFGTMSEELQKFWRKEIKGEETEPKSYYLPQPIAVTCIVLTQNCDITTGRNLLCAKIKPKSNFSKKANKRRKEIKNILRNETRGHYLPPDPSISLLSTPHLIDLKEIFTVPVDLVINDIDSFFIARLVPVAVTILKEKITRYFTRLPFDEEIFYTDEEILSILEEGGDIIQIQMALEKVGRKLERE